MAKDPAFLFYPSDFLTGVSDLTMEERGQYITLLCLQHQKDILSEKTIRLTVGSVSVDVLKKFTKDDDGNYFNERLNIEISKRAVFVDSRRSNGQKGGRPKENKKPLGYPDGNPDDIPNVLPKNNLSINENINRNIIDNKEEIEIFNFSEILKIYSNKTYESQSQAIKDKFTKIEFESYLWFLSLFEKFKNRLSKHEFPLLSRYRDDIYLKFKKEEIEAGAKKLQSLGINPNADFVCRFIDCIGFATKNNLSVNKQTDINTMNDMGQFQNIKPHLSGSQSFKPKTDQK